VEASLAFNESTTWQWQQQRSGFEPLDSTLVLLGLTDLELAACFLDTVWLYAGMATTVFTGSIAWQQLESTVVRDGKLGSNDSTVADSSTWQQLESTVWAYAVGFETWKITETVAVVLVGFEFGFNASTTWHHLYCLKLVFGLTWFLFDCLTTTRQQFEWTIGFEFNDLTTR